MTRIRYNLVKAALCAGAITTCLASAPAQAQVEIRVFPPPAFVVTASPEYYEGHATYWYQNHWYYRDGSAWRYYNEEPAHLRSFRGRHERGRQFYGRAHQGGLRRR